MNPPDRKKPRASDNALQQDRVQKAKQRKNENMQVCLLRTETFVDLVNLPQLHMMVRQVAADLYHGTGECNKLYVLDRGSANARLSTFSASGYMPSFVFAVPPNKTRDTVMAISNNTAEATRLCNIKFPSNDAAATASAGPATTTSTATTTAIAAGTVPSEQVIPSTEGNTLQSAALGVTLDAPWTTSAAAATLGTTADSPATNTPTATTTGPATPATATPTATTAGSEQMTPFAEGNDAMKSAVAGVRSAYQQD